jgi:CrcB protein
VLIAAVGIGSAIGGIARFLLGALIQRWAGSTFPFGTLVINITGSILLGFLIRYALATPTISPTMRAMLTTGFCGGYTTFSTFTYETATLFEEADYRRAFTYVLLSVCVALAGIFLGFSGARALVAFRERV